MKILRSLGRTWPSTRHAFLWVLLCLSTCTLHAKSVEETRIGLITRVVDGDTVWVKSGGELLKVRITGIDAPEICQDGGPQSREQLRNRSLGKIVTLISRHHDDYGRLLARVELDGNDLGRWMVSQGQAWSYGYRNYAGPYAQEQADAKALSLGLFGLKEPENPRNFRKRRGACFP